MVREKNKWLAAAVSVKSLVPSLCRECHYEKHCTVTHLVAGLSSIKTGDAALTSYRHGTPVFTQGSPATGVHVVCRGFAICLKHDGAESVFQVFGSGSFPGIEDCVLGNSLHGSSCVALGDTVIAFISWEFLSKRMEEDNACMKQLLMQVCRQLNDMHDFYWNQQSPVLQRVMHLFFRLVSLSGQKDSSEAVLPFPFDRVLLSRIIGIAPETLSRVMTQLARRGLVMTTRNQVRFPDVRRLQHLAKAL